MVSNDTDEVTIIGGGLAGMTAAYKLAERDCSVTLVEASDRLGGKAGASTVSGNVEEHGYHIFPAWYENTWDLVDDFGIRDSFEDVENFHQLRPDEHPSYHTFRNLASPRNLLHNVTAGIMPVAESFLFLYATLDLMSQPYRRREKLDQITINGFLRSRFYRTGSVAERFQDLILKGISVPTYEVSAMTMRNMMRYWLRDPEPMHRILQTDLQSGLIRPFEQRLVESGCEIEKGLRVEKLVVEQGRIQSVVLRTETGETQEREVDSVVLAIPAEKVAQLIDDDLHAAAPELSDVKRLTTQPMAALHVHFDRTLPDIPRDHVNLLKSKYGLSYIDVSQWWEDEEGTVLNVISSDFEPLCGLSTEATAEELLDDLKPFLPPFDDSDIDTTHLQTHEDEPLFMNEVGIWTHRPEARTSLSNLYLAGDYCRSHVDIVSMESAVTTGLHAAEAVRDDLELESPVTIRRPDTYPQPLLALARLALAPVALVARFLAD